ncbi:NACHT domain-containing protein [Streptomyces spectabilis]|uniref:NACHT domain-containing protein n=1 Tax=Streptomyces spectabilis TaxID=68270 RepID=A0A7W8B4M4_STRST|nr:hypothetical protein [Streptomyces spectabilis]MBB5109832.1 hypothetical protein [Streptomyces spectabilis]
MAAAVLVAAAVFGWVGWQIARGGLSASDKATVLSLGLAVVALLLVVPSLRLARAALGRQEDAAALARSTADSLAANIAQLEGGELQALRGAARVDDEKLINVRFRRLTPATRPGGLTRTGRLTDGRPNYLAIIDYFRRCDPARLVILGAPGAGKTVIALELITELLDRRQDGEPVPVRIPLAQWDTDLPLEDFLTRYLTEAYDVAEDRATYLITQRLILPVLDGLDEMDAPRTDADGRPLLDSQGRPKPDPNAPHAKAALKALNNYRDGKRPGPLILTCRTTHYPALTDTDRLGAATEIEIQNVTARQAHTYLTARCGHNTHWNALLDTLDRDRHGPLTRYLTTPWRLGLAATVYRDNNPAPLLAHTTATERDELLLSQLIEATAEVHPALQRYGDHTRVTAWLAILARHLDTSATGPHTDIHLHKLWPLAGPRRVPVWDAALTALLSGTVGLLLLVSSIGIRWQGAVFFASLVITTAAMAAKPNPEPVRWNWHGLRIRQLTFAFAGGLVLGSASGFAIWLVFEFVLGIVVGFSDAIAFGLAFGSAGEPSRTATPGEVIGADVTARLVGGLVFGLVGGPAPGFVGWFVVGSVGGVRFGLAGGAEAARRYLVFLLLSRRRRLPFEFGRFLDRAYRASLLRRSANAYQFRHRELQQWLARLPEH